MSYYIDLELISLDDFQIRLHSSYLAPSRMLLRKKTADRFASLKNMGIHNLGELVVRFKKINREDHETLEQTIGIEYLTILLREVNSMRPKPVKLHDFELASHGLVENLKKSGIQNTLQLYPLVINRQKRQILTESLSLNADDLLVLTRLTDLVRIKWVGAAFACMLFNLGVDSALKASRADPWQLYEAIKSYNLEKNVFKGHIGLNDIQIFVQAAAEIPFDIQF